MLHSEEQGIMHNGNHLPAVMYSQPYKRTREKSVLEQPEWKEVLPINGCLNGETEVRDGTKMNRHTALVTDCP